MRHLTDKLSPAAGQIYLFITFVYRHKQVHQKYGLYYCFQATSKPKILSPRDAVDASEGHRRRHRQCVRRKSSGESKNVKNKSLRKLSDEFGSMALPSRSGYLLILVLECFCRRSFGMRLFTGHQTNKSGFTEVKTIGPKRFQLIQMCFLRFVLCHGTLWKNKE